MEAIKPLAELLERNDRAELEEQKHLRDFLVANLRDEMRQLHYALEPHWDREQAENAGPAHLANVVVPGAPSFGQMSIEKLHQLATSLMDEIRKRTGGVQ